MKKTIMREKRKLKKGGKCEKGGREKNLGKQVKEEELTGEERWRK